MNSSISGSDICKYSALLALLKAPCETALTIESSTLRNGTFPDEVPTFEIDSPRPLTIFLLPIPPPPEPNTKSSISPNAILSNES